MEANTVVLPIEKYDYFMENERKLQTIINSEDRICIYRYGRHDTYTILNHENYSRQINSEIYSLKNDIQVLTKELNLSKNQNTLVCEDFKFGILNKSWLFRLLNKFIFKVK